MNLTQIKLKETPQVKEYNRVLKKAKQNKAIEELWDDAIKRDGWEKEFNNKFNKPNAFLVFKFLPYETYSNAVWEVRDFITKALTETRKEVLEEVKEIVGSYHPIKGALSDTKLGTTLWGINTKIDKLLNNKG